jgi:hypothetical protein
VQTFCSSFNLHLLNTRRKGSGGWLFLPIIGVDDEIAQLFHGAKMLNALVFHLFMERAKWVSCQPKLKFSSGMTGAQLVQIVFDVVSMWIGGEDAYNYIGMAAVAGFFQELQGHILSEIQAALPILSQNKMQI